MTRRLARKGISIGGALVLALACGGQTADAEHIGSCAGDYEGIYKGDVTGVLSGLLEPSGRFTVSFRQSGSMIALSGSGKVEEDGSIDIVIQENTITGTLNTERCSAKGKWRFIGASGTWEASKVGGAD